MTRINFIGGPRDGGWTLCTEELAHRYPEAMRESNYRITGEHQRGTERIITMEYRRVASPTP